MRRSILNTSSILPGPDRFERQKGLISTARLRDAAATVIGVGAIGRQVAIQLAALGVGNLQLIDFDTVELHNVTSQGYRHSEIGQYKVAATLGAVAEIDPEIRVESWCDRFRRRIKTRDVVFCCVDSIQTRTLIWDHLKNRTEFWADARMLGEVIRVLTSTDSRSQEAYQQSLFAPSEAQTGSCTSRSTIYTANIAAGLLVHQFTRWLRKLPLADDMTMNLLSSELTVNTFN